MKVELYVCLASQHFHSGIDSLQQGNYKKALYEFKECHYPIHEGKNYGKDIIAIEGEVRVLEEDLIMHSCMVESIQAREIGLE